jgi:general stress protein 26
MSARETMQEVLENHNLMHLATVDSDGRPCLRGVDYAAGAAANVLYFVTGKDSRKVQHIKANNNVAVAIDHDCPKWEDLGKLKYIKGTGVASIIESAEEAKMAMGLLLEKFPFLANLPGDPSDFITIKVELKEVLVTNNTITFAHTDELKF